MNDLISRKTAIEALGKEGLITAMVIVDRVPSAQPERKKGKWILQIRYDNKGEPLLAWYQCSECGAFIANNEANFCSACGADMREVVK